MSVYAVEFRTDGVRPTFRKTEISAFITERALITVRKSPGDTSKFIERWDARGGRSDHANRPRDGQ